MGEPVIGTEIAEEGVSIVALHEHDLGLGIQLRVGLGGRIVRDTRLQGHGLPRVLRSHRRRQGASGPRAPPGQRPQR